MLIGYARSSSVDDAAGLDDQIRDLTAAGCEDVFHDKVSPLTRERPDLDRAIRFLRKGDHLVVTALDRVAYSVANLMDIHAALEAKGADLRVLAMGLDTATPTGRLMMKVLADVAEFERNLKGDPHRDNGGRFDTASHHGAEPAGSMVASAAAAEGQGDTAMAGPIYPRRDLGSPHPRTYEAPRPKTPMAEKSRV